MRSLVLVMMVFLPGCLASANESPLTSDAQLALPTPDEPVFSATDCLQYHAYFGANKSDFEGFLPDGFAIDSTEAGTFDLRIETTQCPATAEQAPTTQLWIELPVIPPSVLTVPDHGHLLPIEVYASSEELRSMLENLSVPFVVGCHCAATTITDGPVIVDEIVSRSLGGVYELRTSMAPSSGPFVDEQWVRYIAHEGELLSMLRVNTTEAHNRGAGTVAFHYSGPGGAPPFHAGIVHSVDGVSLEIRSKALRLQQSL